MAAVNPPSWVESSTLHHARLARLISTGILAQAGVWNSTDLAVTTPGGSLNLSVAAGGCYVQGNSQTAQGSYACYNDATVTLTVKAGGASTRTDRLVAQIHDSFIATPTNTDANSSYNRPSADTWGLVLIDGTSTAPSLPTLPANVLELARITVPSGAGTLNSGNITDLRVPALMDGSVLVVASKAALPTSVPESIKLAYATLEDNLYRWNGSAWLTPLSGTKQVAYGSATGITTASDGGYTFAHGLPFTPTGGIVQVQNTSTSGFTPLAAFFGLGTLGATNAKFRVYNTSTGAAYVGGLSHVDYTLWA